MPEKRQEVPVLLVDGELQEHLLDVCVDDILVRTEAQEHVQHGRHVLGTGVQHAVEQNAVHLGGTVEDTTRAVQLVRVEDDEVGQKVRNQWNSCRS